MANVEQTLTSMHLFRAVGTFARALDCSSSIRQPSLHMSAAAASRDITLVRVHPALFGILFLFGLILMADSLCGLLLVHNGTGDCAQRYR